MRRVSLLAVSRHARVGTSQSGRKVVRFVTDRDVLLAAPHPAVYDLRLDLIADRHEHDQTAPAHDRLAPSSRARCAGRARHQ